MTHWLRRLLDAGRFADESTLPRDPQLRDRELRLRGETSALLMPTKRHKIIGTVELMMSHELPGRSDEKKDCICCPEFQSHVYGVNLILDDFEPAWKYQDRDLQNWLHSVIDLKKMGTGTRIKITAEVI